MAIRGSRPDKRRHLAARNRPQDCALATALGVWVGRAGPSVPRLKTRFLWEGFWESINLELDAAVLAAAVAPGPTRRCYAALRDVKTLKTFKFFAWAASDMAAAIVREYLMC